MPDEKTVIVATDGSDHSLRVLPHAHTLATALGASIELLRIVERSDIDRRSGEDDAAAAERVRGRLTAEMEGYLQRFGTAGQVNVVVAPQREDAAQTLLREGSRGVLLAMHSHGRGGIARIIQGSVALGVLKSVAQPVMLGGPELLPPPVAGDTYRLLVTTDLSPDADEALRAIAPLLEQGSFKVTLVNIHLQAPRGVDNEALRASDAAQLEAKRRLLPPATDVDTHVREIPIGGGIDTAIMEEAERVDAQAIVMATHGHNARHHLLMGSVAMSVLGRSRLPLIVVRAQG
jgi:nucleotide-binding universal stress UspA family protein